MIKILPQDSGKKLPRFIRQTLSGLPLSGVYKMIRVGRIKVNGKKGKLDTVLTSGDEISLYVREEEYEALRKPRKKFVGVSTDIDIIYEDGHLLVVNKPVGLLTHPDASEHKDTLIGRTLAYLYENGEIEDGRSFLPATINRLDRNTSGIVLIGKDSETLRTYAEMVRKHQLQKEYMAIVWGRVSGAGEITNPLVRVQAGGRTLVVEDAQAYGARNAITRYETLGSAAGFSLLRIHLISGRTHQIRAHLQSIHHPLLGDVKYGGKPAFDIQHHLLHAVAVGLPDGRRFEAPFAYDFQRVLQQTGLKRYLPSDLHAH